MKLSTDHIKNIVTGYLKDKPVKRAWLFGSYARGDADETSDVDVLIDFEEIVKLVLNI